MQRNGHHFHGVIHAAHLLEQILDDQLAGAGVSPRQARVLVALKNLGPVSQARLAEAFDIKPASMSTMLDRLFAAGLVSRESDPKERRRNVIDLTDRGHSKLNVINQIWAAMDDRIRTLLGESDAEVLFRLSADLRQALGGHPPETSRS